jgi:hypothetical protein
LPDLSITTDKITEALGFTPQSEAQVKAEVKVASEAAAAAQSTADDAHERIDDS